jgi:hypothetical protein
MRMKSLGVTANQINATLRQVNLNAAAARPKWPARANPCACWAMRGRP